MPSYGIDFGTTNSVLAQWSGDRVEVLPVDEPPLLWAQEGFDRVLPSVLAVDPEGATSFGWAARRRHGGKLEAVKRLFATTEFVEIGTHELSVEHAAGLLFGHLRAGSPGVTVDRAVVTVPANSLGLARFRTKLCAGLSGISVPALINEPTAAAMAFAQRSRRDETILVFDWGGGTLDVTVLEAIDGVFMERASKGVARLGGIDLDATFARAIEGGLRPHDWTTMQREQFMESVELAKVRLSTVDETTVDDPTGPPVPVTRAFFERTVAPLVATARGPIAQCLEDLKMGPGDIDRLVMVGGTSKNPAVRAMAAETVGRDPATGIDPMTAVAEGAAIASAILAGDLDLDFFVATEHALGTVVHNDARASFSVLIPRNHQLPAKAKDRYLPATNHQSSVLVQVIEGDPDKPVEHEENVILKEFEIAIEEADAKEDARFDITYSYDIDGILTVLVTDVRSGRVLLRDDVSFGVSRDKAGLKVLADKVRTVAATGHLDSDPPGPHGPPSATGGRAADPQVTEMAEAVRTKVMPFVGDDERARLVGMVRDLESGPDVDAALVALDRELRSYSYLL